MEKEPQENKLNKQLVDSFRIILQQNTQLAKSVEDTFGDGESNFDPTEVAAALHLIEGLSRTVREGVERDGAHIIFSRDHISADQPLLQEIQPEDHLEQLQVETGPQIHQGTVLEEAQETLQQEQPKTFGDLLSLRLDQRLPNKEEFTRGEAVNFIGNIRGNLKILQGLKGNMYSREELIRILQQALTTPAKNFRRKGPFVKSGLVMPRSTYTKASDLNKWSSEIGHDWLKTPEVNFEEAMQIRGLAMLEKVNLPTKTSE